MKTKQFLAAIMAATMLVGFNACEENNKPETPDDNGSEQEALKLSESTKELNVDDTFVLTANKEVEWRVVSQSDAVTIDKTSGKEVTVTAVAAGAATVIASVGDEQEFCTITVTDPNAPSIGGATTIAATEIYPIILDGITAEANKDKIVYDFRVNDDTNNLYIWTAGETYNAGEGAGLNFYGNTEGYVSLTVATAGWSGLGFSVSAQASEINDMIAKMVASPDDYYFHMGIKSTDNATHWFYLLGNTPGCDVVVGPTDFNDNGTIHKANYDFTRNDTWQSIDVPMSSMTAALATLTITDGCNILCALSGGVTGTQLNLDACYFYKK